MIVFLPVEEVGIRDGAFLERPRLRVDSEELVGTRERQRIEKHTVDDGEEGGVRADAQGQRQNSNRREAGILSQHAQSVADILPETHHWTLSSDTHPGRCRASGRRNEIAAPFVPENENEAIIAAYCLGRALLLRGRGDTTVDPEVSAASDGAAGGEAGWQCRQGPRRGGER